AVLPNACTVVKHGTIVLALDQQGDQADGGEEQQRSHARDGEVEQPLHHGWYPTYCSSEAGRTGIGAPGDATGSPVMDGDRRTAVEVPRTSAIALPVNKPRRAPMAMLRARLWAGALGGSARSTILASRPLVARVIRSSCTLFRRAV